MQTRAEACVVEAYPVEVTFLRLAEVCRRVGLSRSTIYARSAAETPEPLFPNRWSLRHHTQGIGLIP